MNKKPTILFLHAGVYPADNNPADTSGVAHADYFQEVGVLTNRASIKNDIHVIQVDIFKNNFGSLFSDNNVCVVYTRQLRDWQSKIADFNMPLKKLSTLAEDNRAIMVNGPDVWKWNYDKGDYLAQLNKAGVPIVTTQVIHPPDLLKTQMSSIIKNYPDGLAVKPCAGARAAGVNFIKPEGRKSNKFTIITPRELKDGPTTARSVDSEQLDSWFAEYVGVAKNLGVLVQEFVPIKQEVSIISIKGKNPYAVLRTTGEDTGIAHENFGGRNIPLDSSQVAPEIFRFAQATIDAMPEGVREAQFHRVDVFVTPKGISLLEVEDGSARLFMSEKKALNLYEWTADLAVHQDALKQAGKRKDPPAANAATFEPIDPMRAKKILQDLNRAAGNMTRRESMKAPNKVAPTPDPTKLPVPTPA